MSTAPQPVPGVSERAAQLLRFCAATAREHERAQARRVAGQRVLAVLVFLGASGTTGALLLLRP